MQKDFSQKLEKCLDYADIFEVVKEIVLETLGKSRAGLMLGLADFGGSKHSFLGAFYPVASNMIVMNSFPLQSLKKSNPQLLKPYTFMVLLHEYIHSLGFLDEQLTRELTFKICLQAFGINNLAIQMAKGITAFLPEFSFQQIDWFPESMPEMLT